MIKIAWKTACNTCLNLDRNSFCDEASEPAQINMKPKLLSYFPFDVSYMCWLSSVNKIKVHQNMSEAGAQVGHYFITYLIRFEICILGLQFLVSLCLISFIKA